jgi:hypothetical protein
MALPVKGYASYAKTTLATARIARAEKVRGQNETRHESELGAFSAITSGIERQSWAAGRLAGNFRLSGFGGLAGRARRCVPLLRVYRPWRGSGCLWASPGGRFMMELAVAARC